jgi:hypothetical protein
MKNGPVFFWRFSVQMECPIARWLAVIGFCIEMAMMEELLAK